MSMNIDTEQMSRKFFQYDVRFKNYNEITQEKIEELQEAVKRFEDCILIDLNEKSFVYKIDRYGRTLAYLTHHHRLTFDEKLVFLIMTVDPECLAFKTFKKAEIVPQSQINLIEDKKLRDSAFKDNEARKLGLQSDIRQQIGFFDYRLIKFEDLYLRKFKNELLEVCANDFGDNLFRHNFDFSKLDEKAFTYVKNRVAWYRSVYQNYDIKTIIYHILFQNNILRLKNREQQILFFILFADPEFNNLVIYNEETKWESIEARIKEEFGYYNPHMLFVENAYQKVCVPEFDKKLLF